MSRNSGLFVLVLTAITAITSCATSKKFISLSASGMRKDYWLVGSWNQENSKTIEEWKYIDKNTLSGRLYSAVKGDTFVVETFKIERKEKEIILTMNSTEARVTGLTMKLKEEAPGKLLFESATEKYPKYISYTMNGNNKTTVFEGEDAIGELIKREFNFSKTVPSANK